MEIKIATKIEEVEEVKGFFTETAKAGDMVAFVSFVKKMEIEIKELVESLEEISMNIEDIEKAVSQELNHKAIKFNVPYDLLEELHYGK